MLLELSKIKDNKDRARSGPPNSLPDYMKNFVNWFAYFKNKGIDEKDRQHLTPLVRTKNTGWGLTYLLLAGYIPWWGFIDNQSKKQGFDLIQSNQNNFLTTPRNSLSVAPILAQFFSKMFSIPLYDAKQQETFILGIRNLSILINSVVTAPFILYYYSLPQKLTFFLFKKYKSFFVWVVYPLQGLIMSYTIVKVEHFLDNYGYGDNNMIFYYQLSELFISVSRRSYTASAYTPFVLFFIIFMSNKLYSRGDLKIAAEPINHNMFVKPIVLNRYDLISTSLMVYATMKKAFINFFTIIWDPLLTYLKYEKYCLPESIRYSLFFSETFQIILYSPDYSIWKSSFFSKALAQYFLDRLLWLVLTYNIQYFVLSYSKEYILYNLDRSKLRLKDIPSETTQREHLGKVIPSFKRAAIVQSLPLIVFVDLCAVLSICLKGADFLYFYCRLKQLVQALKTSPDLDLIYPLRKLKALLR